MPIPAIIGALGALAAGGLSHLSARSQQNRAISAQRSMQAMLANNAGTIMARNAKQAGLSPAFSLANGSIPTASAPSAPSASFDASGFQSLLGGYAQRKLQRQQEKVAKNEDKIASANAKVAEEKAQQEAIITEQMKGKNSAANSYGAVYIDPTTKQVIEGLGDNNISEWLKSHPGVAMPHREEPVGYMGQLEFDDWLAEYEAKNSERSGRQNEVITQNVEREAREAQARLNQAISQGKLSRSDIMESIIDMPKQERRSLIADIENKGLVNVWQDLKNKEARESSLGRVIEQLRDDSISFGDKLLISLIYLANTFIGSTSMSFSKKF